MPKRSRRTFTPDFKARLVLDVLTGKQSQAELCRQHNLKPELLARWKVIFLQRMALVFEEEENRSHEAGRITELEQLVGRLTLEKEVLKKASTWLPSTADRNGRLS